MPDNYAQTLETPGIPQVATGGYQVQNNANIIAGIGQAADAVAPVIAERRANKEATEGLGGFYDAMNAVNTKEAEYYQRRDAYQMGLTAPDEKLVSKYTEEVRKLTNGESQGVLTPIQAALARTNALKAYTAAYPALGKEFRAIANEQSGDLARAQKEQYGEDPYSAAAKEDAKTAAQRGITVAQLRHERRKEDEANQAKFARDKLKYDKDVTKEEVFNSLNNEFATDAPHLANTVRQRLMAAIKEAQAQGHELSNPEIQSVLGYLKNTYMAQARKIVADAQMATDERPGFVLSKEEQSQLYQHYEDLFTNMTTEILAADTIDNKTKLLQARTDYAVATGKERWTAKLQDSPYVILANNPEALANLSALDQSTEGQIMRMMEGGKMGPLEAMADLETTFKAKNDVAGLASLQRLRSGQSIMPITMGYGNISQGMPPSTGDKVTDYASKAVALKVHDGLPADKRPTNVVRLARALEFEDLLASPKVKMDIRNNPEATMIVVDKAAQHVIPMLGEPGTPTEMQIDWSYPNHPFRYKQVDAGGEADSLMQVNDPNIRNPDLQVFNSQEAKNIELLNKTYRDLRDLLGYSGVKQWVTTLEQFGVKDATSGAEALTPTRNKPSPKTKAVESNPQASTESTLLRLNRELNSVVPDAVVLAIAEQESGMGIDILNESSGAAGVMQVMPRTFDAVNKKYFDGKLVADDPAHEDRSRAGIALLNELWQRYDGDINKILSDYHGGPDLNMEQSDASGKKNADYVREVKAKIRKRLNG